MLSTSVAHSLSDQVYDQLLALLSTPEYGRDARLPSEEAMSQRFGVSRPVLRQALSRLRSEGLIYARKGSGNFVGDPGPPVEAILFGTLSSIPDVRSFLEFRCSLEGESAARAAQRRDRADLARIHECQLQLEEVIAAGGSGIEEDIAFHATIAQASGNRFFALTIAALAEQTRFSIRLVRELSNRDAPSRFEEVKREHAAIVEAIASGNPEAARQAMTAHLQGGIARLFGQ
jgi:GntR family transcriptional repressor for pyruvate dehydrogenase complex